MNVPSENAQPRGRGRPPVGDKPRRILDAAVRVFAERGYHGTSVPDVAGAAGVGMGTLYRYFPSKEHLVNEVFRDAKRRLASALLDGASDERPLSTGETGEDWFMRAWRRLARFAQGDPVTFRFLEMQDHTPYLDTESLALERAVLEPLKAAGDALRGATPGLPVDVTIAVLWGAFTGVVKAERLGYLTLDETLLMRVGRALWPLVSHGSLNAPLEDP